MNFSSFVQTIGNFLFFIDNHVHDIFIFVPIFVCILILVFSFKRMVFITLDLCNTNYNKKLKKSINTELVVACYIFAQLLLWLQSSLAHLIALKLIQLN